MSALLTPAEMNEADRRTIAGGMSGYALMQRAGAEVAREARRMLADASGRSVLVVAGPGNNGGDGLVAAEILRRAGTQVQVMMLGDEARLAGDAARARGDLSSPLVPFTAGFSRPALVIDALFGAGLSRPLEGEAAAAVEAINAAGAPVLAVDLPSGIDGATGGVLGHAVRADATVTFFRRKPAHLLLPGRLHCGRTTCVDIGIPESVLAGIAPKTFVTEPALWRAAFPEPRVDGHKYTRGHAVIVSGGLLTTGAARLAARGALRAGAGLVTIASPADAVAIHAASNLAIMVRQVDGADGLAGMLTDRRFNAVVLGPGGGVGEGMRTQVTAARAAGCATVLDADALTSFAGGPGALRDALARGEGPVVLTPHGGEFSRLFGGAEGSDKLSRARAAAAATGAIVLYKGADSVVAAPDGRAAIAENAPPYLATAGAGDVLAGMIAGLLARGMAAFEATCAAVWLHGEAACAFGPGLIAEDLPETLPRVLARLLAEPLR